MKAINYSKAMIFFANIYTDFYLMDLSFSTLHFFHFFHFGYFFNFQLDYFVWFLLFSSYHLVILKQHFVSQIKFYLKLLMIFYFVLIMNLTFPKNFNLFKKIYFLFQLFITELFLMILNQQFKIEIIIQDYIIIKI